MALRLISWSGINVRISDALAGDAARRVGVCWSKPIGWSHGARQIALRRFARPSWGVSESGLQHPGDLELTYQYSLNFSAFLGLGLKRGLGESAVVAPYATAPCHSMVDPPAAA